jgi:alpha-L-rhamnosidase
LVGDITWVKADHKTPYGTVKTEWKKKGNELQLTVSVPPNTTANIQFPLEWGLLWEKKFIFRRKLEGVRAYNFTIGSGRYTFYVKHKI